MKIELEIGKNLRGVVETLVRVTGTEEDLGKILQDAFNIDFSRLIKEHSEAGDVSLEVKDTPDLDYEKLKQVLYPFVGAKLGKFSDEEMATLITIAKALYWRSALDHKISLFKEEIERKLND